MSETGMEEVDVRVHKSNAWARQFSNLTLVKDVVVHIDSKNQFVKTKSGAEISYSDVCVCTGASPKSIMPSVAPIGFEITLRDTDSVVTLVERLSTCQHVALIGNGGIALDLVYVCHCVFI